MKNFTKHLSLKITKEMDEEIRQIAQELDYHLPRFQRRLLALGLEAFKNAKSKQGLIVYFDDCGPGNLYTLDSSGINLLPQPPNLVIDSEELNKDSETK